MSRTIEHSTYIQLNYEKKSKRLPDKFQSLKIMREFVVEIEQEKVLKGLSFCAQPRPILR